MAAVEAVCLFLAACYGGYFGAGLGIILLAVLGLFSALRFNQLNAIKQLLSIVVGVTSATFLAFSSHVEWVLVACMVPGSLIGGSARRAPRHAGRPGPAARRRRRVRVRHRARLRADVRSDDPCCSSRMQRLGLAILDGAGQARDHGEDHVRTG